MKRIVYQGKTARGLEIVVRYPVKEDLEILRNYINTLSKERTYIRFQDEQLTKKEESKYLDTLLKRIKKREAVSLLAFNNGNLIALTDINLKDKIESHVGGFGITVAKEFRNQGIGKLLMDLVFREGKKQMPKLEIVTLGVFANNPVARKMYKKFGFREYGRLPEGIKHKNCSVDHLYLYKKV